MIALLAKILPLQLAATLSPGIFALTIILFTKKNHAIGRVLALLLGSIFVAIFLGFLGLKTGQSITAFSTHGKISVIIDFALAILFLYFGIKGLVKPDREKKESLGENPARQLGKWFIVGLIISITNFDAVLLNFAAAKEIGASGIILFDKIILLFVGILFFVLPILIPLFFYLILPSLAQKVLTPINKFLVKFGRLLVSIIFIIFAIYLIYKGLK
ncbi:MAG: GAP family protein [Patescibacteria group bacterium]|jgi:threonine/homoserine/homoserine lactone efflux protein